MDITNPVIKLCIQGTQAEFQGRITQANSLYWKAWDIAQDDYDACVAAHYIAHLEENPREKFRWNGIALEKAAACDSESIREFYPSLLVNMGQSFESLGNVIEAQRYYGLAADLGLHHDEIVGCPTPAPSRSGQRTARRDGAA